MIDAPQSPAPDEYSLPRLRVAFVIDDSLDYLDGVQRYCLTIGAWLESQGHEVHFLVGQTDSRLSANVHPLARNLTLKANGNLIHVPFMPQRSEWLDRVRAGYFDVLHVQLPHTPLLGHRVVNRASALSAVVGTFHVLGNGWKEDAFIALSGTFMRRSIRRLDASLATSDVMAAYAHRTWHLRPEVIPVPVDTAPLRGGTRPSDWDPSRTHMVFVGRLVPRKGAAQLIRALPYIPAVLRRNLRVHVFGSGPQAPVLEKLVDRHCLREVVSLEGYLPEAMKADVLAGADVAVFPASSGESFGIVLVEAVAAGAGIVAAGNNAGYSSTLSATPEALVDAGDPVRLGVELTRLLHHRSAWADIRRRQAAECAQYDIQEVGPRILSVYRRALKRRQTTRMRPAG